MPNDEPNPHLTAPVDLSPEVYAQGADVQLFCCQIQGAKLGAQWVSAAELVYELTGNAGKVVRNNIHFTLDKRSSIDLDLLDGSFEIKRGEKVVATGRKGIEFLMAFKSMSFQDALEYIARTYSLDSARIMAEDYARMQIRALAEKLDPEAASAEKN